MRGKSRELTTESWRTDLRQWMRGETGGAQVGSRCLEESSVGDEVLGWGPGWKGRLGRQARRIEGAGRDSWNQLPENLWGTSSGSWFQGWSWCNWEKNWKCRKGVQKGLLVPGHDWE